MLDEKLTSTQDPGDRCRQFGFSIASNGLTVQSTQAKRSTIRQPGTIAAAIAYGKSPEGRTTPPFDFDSSSPPLFAPSFISHP